LDAKIAPQGVIIASEFTPSPFKSAYVSAKHGIAGLTMTVALELATFKITCNCISRDTSGRRWLRSRFLTQ
jgi:NAD(P)-dependent dehydrogenase (short-subunit alcohol dehydrogenase family)